jgi:hypothetical protein
MDQAAQQAQCGNDDDNRVAWHSLRKKESRLVAVTLSNFKLDYRHAWTDNSF